MSAWYKVTISGSSPDSLLAQAGFEPSVPRKIPGTPPCWFSFALRLTGNQAASWHAVLMVRIHSPPAVSHANHRFLGLHLPPAVSPQTKLPVPRNGGETGH